MVEKVALLEGPGPRERATPSVGLMPRLRSPTGSARPAPPLPYSEPSVGPLGSFKDRN